MIKKSIYFFASIFTFSIYLVSLILATTILIVDSVVYILTLTSYSFKMTADKYAAIVYNPINFISALLLIYELKSKGYPVKPSLIYSNNLYIKRRKTNKIERLKLIQFDLPTAKIAINEKISNQDYYNFYSTIPFKIFQQYTYWLDVYELLDNKIEPNN